MFIVLMCRIIEQQRCVTWYSDKYNLVSTVYIVRENLSNFSELRKLLVIFLLGLLIIPGPSWFNFQCRILLFVIYLLFTRLFFKRSFQISRQTKSNSFFCLEFGFILFSNAFNGSQVLHVIHLRNI